MYIYFLLISFSLIGYGFIIKKFLKIHTNCLGILGLLGITFIAFISFSTTILFRHDILFNSIILIIGIVFFLIHILYISKNELKKQFLIFTLVFLFLFIFITISKNHDDFPYYHFPYSHLLTQFSHPIGIGLWNNGFRNPSSIFFINSLFFLPIKKYYLFHLTPAFVLGFSNIFLINNIFNKHEFNKNKLISILSLLFFFFLNVFFYRLSEHGTDRSGMILTMVAIIFLIKLIIDKKKFYQNRSIDNLKIFSVIICFVVSIKPFYLINLGLFLIILSYKDLRKIFFNQIFSKTFFYCISFIIFIIFYTFINSGCLIYPIISTCFDNISWYVGDKHTNDVRIWFELWSKGGANPHTVVKDKINYISNLNWLKNWIDVYFFNKVSDFLISIIIFISVFFLSFKEKFFISNRKIFNLKALYLLLFIFFLEWFFEHPTLRYGGYHIIALLFFVPLAEILANQKIQFNRYVKKSIIWILITLFLFFVRNTLRLEDEFNKYLFNPIIDENYKFIGGDETFHKRYSIIMKKNISNYRSLNVFNKKKFIITIKK
jgi:hypothetical protein